MENCFNRNFQLRFVDNKMLVVALIAAHEITSQGGRFAQQ